MKKYSVYCNFFVKKICYNVFADSEESAIRLTRLKIVIDKVTCDVPKEKDNPEDVFKEWFCDAKATDKLSKMSDGDILDAVMKSFK